MMPAIDFRLISPEIFLVAWAFVVLFADLFVWRRRADRGTLLAWLSCAGLVATIVLVFNAGFGATFDGALQVDAFAFLFQLVCLGTGVLTVMLCSSLSDEIQSHRGEFYSLLLFSTVGMLFLVAANELITLYVSLELVTIPLFVLVAFSKRDRRSIEAGIKYLIIGAFSSALLLFGFALLYGLTGFTDFVEIKKQLVITFFKYGQVGPVLSLSLLFVIAGLGFKLAVVPFHAWAPDVYEGAPTPVAAFLSVASKAAGVAAFTRLFYRSFSMSAGDWLMPVMILAVLAMVLGNTVAIVQKNIKRLLAYSSIAQVGYILVGFSALSQLGVSSVGLYLLMYLLANLGAFGVVMAVYNKLGSFEIADYAGLSKRNPQLAFILTLCLLSLVGIPPLAGFFGKYYLFLAAIEQRLYWLVMVALLTSVVSLYYYAGIIKVMYFDSSRDDAPKFGVAPGAKLALWIAALGVVAMGVYPTLFLGWAEQAASVFKF
jgi:NADH-quinone oxidoreductase subunit N